MEDLLAASSKPPTRTELRAVASMLHESYCRLGDDGGSGDSFVAYRTDKGPIRDVDVGGIAFALVCRIPGNVLKGNWKVAVYMSDKATPAQKQAILDAWTGKLGGLHPRMGAL